MEVMYSARSYRIAPSLNHPCENSLAPHFEIQHRKSSNKLISSRSRMVRVKKNLSLYYMMLSWKHSKIYVLNENKKSTFIQFRPAINSVRTWSLTGLSPMCLFACPQATHPTTPYPINLCVVGFLGHNFQPDEMVKSVCKRQLLSTENESISYSKCRVLMERCQEAEALASSLESLRNDETEDPAISRGMILALYRICTNCLSHHMFAKKRHGNLFFYVLRA